MLSGILSALLLGGISFFARKILKNNSTLVNSGTFWFLRMILLIWAIFAICAVIGVIYSLVIWDTESLKQILPVIIGLTVSMIGIFLWFRRIVDKQDAKEATVAQTKFSQQVRATFLVELESILSKADSSPSKIKYVIANQIEKKILSMGTKEFEDYKLRFHSGPQKEFIQDQIIEICHDLSNTTMQDDSILLHSIEDHIAKGRAEARIAAQVKSTEVPPPVGIVAESDPTDRNYCFCPNCRTRQRANRTRCMECGEYFNSLSLQAEL